MLARLPEYIEPLHLADKRGALKGQIPLKDLNRLADLLVDDTGSVAIELFFQREGRLATIEGRLEAVLQLKCQSCLAALPWPVNSEVKLGIVTSIAQADKLPEIYEPLMLEGETMPLKELVEDELLLALPAFPKHDYACFKPIGFVEDAAANKAKLIGDDEPSPRENPFSILANLKNTGDL
ncbi:YceD family protein [Methylovulum psychrotolerans]|nr:YceD family protein [Methylovulum psychrotolerans]MBT9096700.1 DUF177 domain-containing protein [Methylovulum psychrotolerans]